MPIAPKRAREIAKQIDSVYKHDTATSGMQGFWSIARKNWPDLSAFILAQTEPPGDVEKRIEELSAAYLRNDRQVMLNENEHETVELIDLLLRGWERRRNDILHHN